MISMTLCVVLVALFCSASVKTTQLYGAHAQVEKFEKGQFSPW